VNTIQQHALAENTIDRGDRIHPIDKWHWFQRNAFLNGSALPAK
jgi:hypothetical protein